MKHNTIQGKIFPVPPFDFSKTISFMNMFTPTMEEQVFDELSFTKAIYLNEQTLAFKIEDIGTIEKPVLEYTFFSENKIEDKIKSELLDRINFFLSLEDDLTQFYNHAMKDKAFKSLVEKLYGLHQVKFLTPFEAAAWAILSQRISMKAAHTMKERLVRAVGDCIEVDQIEYWTFPSANQIKNLGMEHLIVILKNKRKSQYLMNVSESFNMVSEDFLRHAPVDEVKDWLLNIKGVGEWSAHLELIRGLGRMEDISPNDRMLMACAKKIYGKQLTDETINKITKDYGDFKGYWSYYLRVGC